MSFKLTWKSHVICILISLAITVLMYPTVDSILFNFFLKCFNFSEDYWRNFIAGIFLLMVPVTIVHELIHAAAYKIFGGKVEFGVKVIYAYTREISQKPIPRDKFIIILLSPLVIISIASLFIMPWLGGIIFLLNILGASGDIYMALFLCRFNSQCKIIDRIYGFDVVKNN